ncbi:MAG: hydroxymethylbilane synthase [Desulfovibrionales bacterium]
MNLSKITIATRKSKLAMWQAEHIASLLTGRYPGLEVEFLKITTQGDKILDVPLAKVGGKGLFVKEIEEALLDGRADIAVHSMKDVPTTLPQGMKLGVIPQREQWYDLLLTNKDYELKTLPEGAIVGTSSLRRQAQILHVRPDLKVESLRGNLDTRVRKLKEGNFDAIVVAAAGMRRLGIEAAHEQSLVPPDFFPAVAQGALGIEYSKDRDDLDEFLGFMDDPHTRFCVLAERGFLTGLDGGCQVPIAAHARLKGNSLHLAGLVADETGDRYIFKESAGKPKEAFALGERLAKEVLNAGGGEILQEVYSKDF